MDDKYGLTSVELKEYGFKFEVVKWPEDTIEDRLALASTDTGLICRMEYQDVIFNECLVNLDRVLKFIGDAAAGSQELAISIRNAIEAAIVELKNAIGYKTRDVKRRLRETWDY